MNPIKKFILNHAWAIAFLIPGMAVNYLAVALMVVYLHFDGVWVLGPVLIGDIIAFEFNLWISTKLKVSMSLGKFGKYSYALKDEKK